MIIGSKSPVYTKSGLMIATNFNRIVKGTRESYIEISPDKIINDNIKMPILEKYRMNFDMAYYLEYRTKDIYNVKIYHQKRLVDYADYKINFYYVSIRDCVNRDISLSRFF